MKFEFNVDKFIEDFPEIAEAIYRKVDLNFAKEDVRISLANRGYCDVDEEDVENIAYEYKDAMSENWAEIMYYTLDDYGYKYGG